MYFIKTIFLIFTCCFGTRCVLAQAVDSMSLPVYTSASFLYDFPQSFGATAFITLPLNNRLVFINKKGKQKLKSYHTRENTRARYASDRQNSLVSYKFVLSLHLSHEESQNQIRWAAGYRYIHYFYTEAIE